MNKLNLLLMLFLGLMLSACGGSGSDSEADTGIPTAPTATSVRVVDDNGGSAEMGDVLIGEYTYTDINGDKEGSSIFRWFRDGTEVTGATKKTYNVMATDALKVITFEVTPVATTGDSINGVTVVSTNSITISKISNLLNDTGTTDCTDYAFTDTGTDYDIAGSLIHTVADCSLLSTIPTQNTDGYDSDGDIVCAGQDALYGRDATHNDDSDGIAGRSYTKLGTGGGVLLANATSWTCVRDNITGLTWEVKTDGVDFRDINFTYTWYSTDSSKNGGEHGIGDTGVATTTGLETADDTGGLFAGSDNCLDQGRCDTEKYVEDVNSSNGGSGLCGITSWRLPTKQELSSLWNYGGDIDTNYFLTLPGQGRYWTASTVANEIENATYIDHSNGSKMINSRKDTAYFVRLVHSQN